MTVFEPSDQYHWPGNLKKYRLMADGTIKDNSAPAQNAVNATTGFFADGTKSFWSAVDDGPKVTLGGAANVLPDPANRTVYTDLTSGTLNVAGNKVLDGNSAITATMTTGAAPALARAK